jgi:hypothetical protein
MSRLAAILALWLCTAVSALAQDAGKTPLVSVLMINTPANAEPIASLFRNALAALGYVEGRNLRLDFRFAEGHSERFPALAEALVRDKAVVIVTLGQAATRAAQQATSTIPIVAVADDLVASGLIASLARPGGNTTGVSILATELDAKKLEILKEIIPAARRFAVLQDAATSIPARQQAMADVARALRRDHRRQKSFRPRQRQKAQRDGRHRADLRCGDDSAHAGDSVRCGRIDAANPAMGDGAAQDRRMQHGLAPEIAYKFAAAAQKAKVLDPLDRTADVTVGPDHGLSVFW